MAYNNTNKIQDNNKTFAWQAMEQLRADWAAASNPPPAPPAPPVPIPEAYDKTALDLVCKYGDKTALQDLIAGGLDIHSDSDALLIESIENRNIAFADFLLGQGADIHISNEYPLEVAALYGYTEMVRFLLDRGADIHGDDDDILIWATQENGNVETVSLLIERGASVERLNPEHRTLYDKYKTEQLTARRKAVNAEQTLSKIFKTAVWTGHVPEMVKLWEQVPAELQSEFDFSHALADARMQTMKQRRPNIVLVK
jgi:hypothetical protein